jgi:hypothetical protein
MDRRPFYVDTEGPSRSITTGTLLAGKYPQCNFVASNSRSIDRAVGSRRWSQKEILSE